LFDDAAAAKFTLGICLARQLSGVMYTDIDRNKTNYSAVYFRGA